MASGSRSCLVERASAAFVLMRQGILQRRHAFGRPPMQRKACVGVGMLRTKNKSLRNRRGGGGPFCAYCRKRMVGRRFASVADANRGLKTAASS